MSSKPEENWYLADWARHFGKRQADLSRELGWDKATVSFLWNGKQPYRRDHIAALSTWLGIRPFELLMPPAEALSLRKLRDTAVEIAKDADAFRVSASSAELTKSFG